MSRKVLLQKFFQRPVLKASRELIGKYLVRHLRGKEIALMITEVEAYDGQKDKACHACRGKTERNQIMYGEAGRFYIYFTYGMHWMLNIVTGREGYPAAVLIRGLEGVSGPGRLTKKLKITNQLNGKRAIPRNNLWIEDRGVVIPAGKLIRTPRIGVSYAGEWAKKPYRFVLAPALKSRQHILSH